jgi:hypothetical protein
MALKYETSHSKAAFQINKSPAERNAAKISFLGCQLSCREKVLVDILFQLSQRICMTDQFTTQSQTEFSAHTGSTDSTAQCKDARPATTSAHGRKYSYGLNSKTHSSGK